MGNIEVERELMVKISNVKKMYKLGQIGGGTLQADLQSWWARKQGKEDPNTKIGESQKERLVGATFMALNGIDLDIYRGEALGIIGGNGAGKSTLLKLLSQVTAPTSGKIELWGRVASMLEVGTGFNGEMTGRENIYMNGAILGMTKAEIDAKMEDIIDFSEVRDFIDTPVKRYSSGMYVKLAFSVAAHLDSEIMIMDEVLAVGDMAFQKKCLTKMRDAATREGKTVLYVSHNMNTIRQLCDRCIVLEKGQKVYDGEVEGAIQAYLGNRVKSEKVVELEKMKRSAEFLPNRVTMTKLEIMNNERAVYDVGDKIQMQLTYASKDTISDAHLRVIIKAADGTPVTMQTDDGGFNIDAKQSKLSFEMNISSLVPGLYMISLVLYDVNEFGGNGYLDGLKDVYCFEITQKMGFVNNMEWETRYWGYYYNTPFTVKIL